VDVEEYRRLIENTESHWWFGATSKVIELLLESQGHAIRPSALCLDAGGGTGATSSWLAQRATTVLCEYEPMAIQAAVDRFPMYLASRGDINLLPFGDDTFDVVMCVTVLCHEMNRDPAATVGELARVVAPGGRLLLLEPHHPWLWRGHDRVTHSARRFTLAMLRGYAIDAGLRVERATAAYRFLVPAAAAVKLIEGKASKSDVGRNESGLGGLFGKLSALERRWLARHDLRFGLSAVVVASKPA
jgi:SAM-dependent methyltransferase